MWKDNYDSVDYDNKYKLNNMFMSEIDYDYVGIAKYRPSLHVVSDIPYYPEKLRQNIRMHKKNELKNKYFSLKNGKNLQYLKILNDTPEETNSTWVNISALTVEKNNDERGFSYSKIIYYCEFQFRYTDLLSNEITRDEFAKVFNEVVNEFKHEIAEQIEL